MYMSFLIEEIQPNYHNNSNPKIKKTKKKQKLKVCEILLSSWQTTLLGQSVTTLNKYLWMLPITLLQNT